MRSAVCESADVPRLACVVCTPSSNTLEPSCIVGLDENRLATNSLIVIPALRDRPEEIPILVEYFLDLYRRKHRGGPRHLSHAALERLQRYRWPGNVRELENVVQRIVVLDTETVVAELEDVEEHALAPANGATRSAEAAERLVENPLGLKELARRAAEAAEREALKRTLAHVHWRRVAAARRLQISYKTLLEKIKLYGLDSTSL